MSNQLWSAFGAVPFKTLPDGSGPLLGFRFPKSKASLSFSGCKNCISVLLIGRVFLFVHRFCRSMQQIAPS
jgi:hypothetical protein